LAVLTAGQPPSPRSGRHIPHGGPTLAPGAQCWILCTSHAYQLLLAVALMFCFSCPGCFPRWNQRCFPLMFPRVMWTLSCSGTGTARSCGTVMRQLSCVCDSCVPAAAASASVFRRCCATRYGRTSGTSPCLREQDTDIRLLADVMSELPPAAAGAASGGGGGSRGSSRTRCHRGHGTAPAWQLCPSMTTGCGGQAAGQLLGRQASAHPMAPAPTCIPSPVPSEVLTAAAGGDAATPCHLRMHLQMPHCCHGRAC